jgi:predicted GNAT family acetyltransferase
VPRGCGRRRNRDNGNRDCDEDRPRQRHPLPLRTRRRGAIAFANYRRAPGIVIITHTETPRALRGRGIASELVQGALELIRADGDKVVAGLDYLRKHPEFSDLTR